MAKNSTSLTENVIPSAQAVEFVPPSLEDNEFQGMSKGYIQTPFRGWFLMCTRYFAQDFTA